MTSTTDAHTKGPWVADEYPHGGFWKIKYGTRGNWLAEVMIDGDHKGAAADARLIAAAPTMFDYIAARAADGDPEATQIMKSLKATTPNAGEEK